MLLFGIALGLIELVLISVFVLGLILAVSFDRQGKDEPKWVVLGIGLLVFGIMTWSNWTFAGIGATLLTSAFWMPVVKYLGFGLLYSSLEFVREVRKSAAALKDRWERAMSKRVREVFPDVKEHGAKSEHFNVVNGFVNDFVQRHDSTRTIVGVSKGEDYISVEPRINRGELADCISAWTFFWPFYAVSLILGDLLTEVFRVVADFFVGLSGRFVRLSFKDVFKF